MPTGELLICETNWQAPNCREVSWRNGKREFFAVFYFSSFVSHVAVVDVVAIVVVSVSAAVDFAVVVVVIVAVVVASVVAVVEVVIVAIFS